MVLLLKRALPFLLLALPAWAASRNVEGGGTVIRNIGLAIVAASAMGFTMRLLRQPLLLGYIVAGVLLGPVGFRLITGRSDIEAISQIGLILLLFMIGLEIDLRKMLDAGRLVVIAGILQFPLSLALGWLLLKPLAAIGVPLGDGPYAVLYLATAISLSSTMIVVKLLYDKSELDTLAGRITVGILVFQDLWAIVALAFQPDLDDPKTETLVRTFGAGALLVAAALFASRFILPRLFHVVAKVPELMLVISLGWCFLVGLIAAHPAVGLSMEMGALIAGVSLATFPYNVDVNARVLNVRDFFITLFFVSLGMRIPMPEFGVVVAALLVGAVLWVCRFVGVFGILHVLRAGHWSSILPTINLGQMSEFSLVILAFGVQLGHIGADTLTVGIWSFALLAVASTYQIAASQPLERWLSRRLNRAGVRDLRSSTSEIRYIGDRPIVMLGFWRVANEFIEDVSHSAQDLLEEIKVVDFNPEVRERLTALGLPSIYGDIANADTLHHAKLKNARVVISSVPDSALRGTTNLKLLQTIREVCPRAQVIVTAETPDQAKSLYAAGADYVLQPSALAGATLLRAVEQALHGSCEGLREEAVSDLDTQTTLQIPIGTGGTAQAS